MWVEPVQNPRCMTHAPSPKCMVGIDCNPTVNALGSQQGLECVESRFLPEHFHVGMLRVCMPAFANTFVVELAQPSVAIGVQKARCRTSA